MEKKYIEEFYDEVIARKMYGNKRRLQLMLRYIFGKVNLENKNVLDIGGGDGLLSLYAAACNCKKVICLEPEIEGSNNKMEGAYQEFIRLSNLPLKNIDYMAVTLQEYCASQGFKYDVIVMRNSINHLDEGACINLEKKEEAKESYRIIFNKLKSLMNEGGSLIITDCTRYNFFNVIGLTSPLAPTIEWHKHQSPKLWSKLLKESGFRNPRISWSSPNSFGNFGRVLMGNKLVNYFMLSHFRIKLDS